MLDNPHKELQHITTSLDEDRQKGRQCEEECVCMSLRVWVFTVSVRKCVFPSKPPACNPEDKQQR